MRLIFITIIVSLLSSTSFLSAQQLIEGKPAAKEAKQYIKASLEYYPDSTLKKFQTLALDEKGNLVEKGRFVEWYPGETRKIEGFVKNGKLDSLVTEYREDMTRSKETLYRDGKIVNETIYGKRGLYPVGNEEEQKVLTRTEKMVFPDGRLVIKEGYDAQADVFINHGKSAVYFYVDGPVNEEGSFRHGRLQGLITNWREDGTKAYDGTYKNHWMEDLWLYFDESGKLEKEVIYKKSEEVSVKYIDVVSEEYMESDN